MPDTKLDKKLLKAEAHTPRAGLLDLLRDNADLERIAQITSELLDVAEARICVTDGETVVNVSSSGILAGSSQPFAHSPFELVVQRQGTVICNDLRTMPELDQSHPLFDGMRFFAGAPIRDEQGTIVALLSIRSETPRTLTDQEVAGLQQMALLGETTIQRVLADQAAARTSQAFEDLFEHSLAGTILMSPVYDGDAVVDMRLDRVNHAACRLLDITPEQTQGKLHKDVFPGSRDNGIVDSYALVITTGEPFRYEFFYDDGRIGGWYDVMCVKTHGGVAVTFLDVTKRVESELEAREQRRVLELFVKHTPAAVAMLDADMRYIAVSDRWVRDYQLQERDLVGKGHYEVFPEISDEWKQIHQRCIAGEVITRDADAFPRSDGHVEWLRWAIHPWRDPNGEVGGIIMFTEVITKQREADLALRESRQTLDLALECGTIALWDYRITDNTLSCSDRWFTLMGYEPGSFEITRESWGKLLHPDDFRDSEDAVLRMIAGETDDYRKQYRVLTASGEYLWVESVGRVVEWDEQRRPKRALGVYLNIDEQKKAEESVRASERRLNLALDCANAGLWDWPIQSGDAVYSDSWWKQLGYDPENPPFQNRKDAWHSLIHPDDVSEAERQLQRHFDGEIDTYQHEFRLRRNDGKYHWIRGVGRVIERDKDQRPIRMIGINIDICDQRQAQESIEQYARSVAESKAILEAQADELASKAEVLEQTKELAVAASQAKTEFLANMSHEIRTPMTAILGYAELLTDPSLELTERIAHTKTIIRNGEHLLTVINDILDISRIEAGRMTTERIDCSPAEIVSGVIALLEPRATSKNVRLEVEWEEGVPAQCYTDPTRLRQILLNLAGNAIKFTHDGRVTLRVGLEPTQHGSPKLFFDVIDTGIGVPEHLVNTLFQPFSQTDNSHTRRFGGTGLGLSISARLATLLGGSVRLTQSVLDKGSTFRATIDPGPIGQAESAEGVSFQADGTTTKQAVNRLQGRILIAEDGLDNQRLLRHHLEKAGAEVDVVDDGAQAVRAANEALETQKPYQLILMDVQMPVMDGLEAAAALRASNYVYPIVALTAHAMEMQRKLCLDSGCDDHLAKPISRQDLVEACHRWMEHAKTI